jgi:hypothetical protein
MVTLREAYSKFAGTAKESDIPLIIRFLENPLSPFALGGSISLRNHDYLHIILDRGVSNNDEAYIIGFTMGNSNNIKQWHYWVFVFASLYLYPPPYRFDRNNITQFWEGVYKGSENKVKNLAKFNFNWLDTYDVECLKKTLIG